MSGIGSPVFFLSYSINKALRPPTVERFIDLLKNTITRDLECRYLDLFEIDRPGRVHGDLIAALRDCDCVIAETTNAAPNVYFEAGVADALGKPLITFLDRARNADRVAPNQRELATIRERLFGTAHPSDLGDLRYFEYSLPDEPDHQDLQRVSRAQHAALSATIDDLLRASTLQPRRNLQSSFFRGLEAINKYSRAPPKLWLIDGLSAHLTNQYLELPHSRMQVDESLYEHMLKSMGSAMNAKALAIADLQSGLEPFLLKSDPAQVRVRERIFAFDSADAFLPKFEHPIDDLWEHSRAYQCFMIDRAFAWNAMRDSGLLQQTQAISVDMLCTGQSSVWYAVDRSRPHRLGRELLTIDSNPDIKKTIESVFARLREKAVDVSALSAANSEVRSAAAKANLIKSEWLRQREIGHWGKDWTTSDRAFRYYLDYETHIRAWIPDYNRLTSVFVDRAIAALVGMARNGRVMVVEAGPGTGEATEKILQGIAERAHGDEPSPVTDYWLYEKDPAMLDRLAERGLIGRTRSGFAPKMFGGDAKGGLSVMVRPKNAFFIEGTEPEARTTDDAIILGSLVHHYVDVLDQAEPDLDAFMQAVGSRFPNAKEMILAGVFYSGNLKTQVAAWQSWMNTHSGLSERAVEDFFAGNQEMQRPFTVKELKRVSEGRGWRVDFIPTHNKCPFGVVHLRRERAPN